MSLPGQRVQQGRYQVIPRTLIFLLFEDEVLLLRIAAERGAWAGLYNGVGGHIESSENPYAAALREVHEETGLEPIDLRLCGVIIVHPGSSPGIEIHVFVGKVDSREVKASNEGDPEWIPLDLLVEKPLVEDLPLIIPQALAAYHSRQSFCGLTTFDDAGNPILHFLP